jgi:hypothetical protein
LAYGIFEIPTGALGDRIGHAACRPVVLWWSLPVPPGAAIGFRRWSSPAFSSARGSRSHPNISGAIVRWFPARERADLGFHLGREPYGRRAFAADRCAAAVGCGMAIDVRRARRHRNRLGGFLEGGIQRPSRSRLRRTRTPAFRRALGGTAPAAPAVAHLHDVFFPGLGLLVLFRLVPGLSGQSRGFHRSRDGRLFRPSVFVWGLWKRRRRIPERPARGSLRIEDWTPAGWFGELGDVGPSTRRHDDDPR